jgi:pyruvate kinase
LPFFVRTAEDIHVVRREMEKFNEGKAIAKIETKALSHLDEIIEASDVLWLRRVTWGQAPL